MKQLRHAIPFLVVFALAALFFSLPETPDIFSMIGCKSCSSSSPYIPLIGSGYFAALATLSLLFPSFPSRRFAQCGLIWAVLLAAVLTYVHFPLWCAACLFCHACNILIWTIWAAFPSQETQLPASPFRERLCLTLFVPLSVVALFSCLNLTFMAYGFKGKHPLSATDLRLGDPLPAFSAQTISGRSIASADATSAAGIVINFISPDCPHCKEQLVVLDAIASQLASGSYRFINVSPMMFPELLQRSPASEWVEDRESSLRMLFKVSGYPTLFVVGPDGKIAQVIPGVPDQLKEHLLTSLLKTKKS